MALTLLTALLLAMLNTAAVGSASVASDTGATVVRVQPATGSTVGVAHPVIVTFAAPVAESARAGVESTIKITAPANPTGSFEWLDDHTVQFVPTEFWPAHSQIKGSVGAVPLNFETGAAVLGVASISKHTFTVSIDGAVARTMPASMGKPKHPTPVGSFTVLEKQNPVVMDSRTIGIPLNDPEGLVLQHRRRRRPGDRQRLTRRFGDARRSGRERSEWPRSRGEAGTAAQNPAVARSAGRYSALMACSGQAAIASATRSACSGGTGVSIASA
jgi:lipoprotein-anchoring transpeptidase ErfK/SrfK